MDVIVYSLALLMALLFTVLGALREGGLGNLIAMLLGFLLGGSYFADGTLTIVASGGAGPSNFVIADHNPLIAILPTLLALINAYMLARKLG